MLLALFLVTLCPTMVEAKMVRTIEHPRMGWRNTGSLEIDRIVLSDTATVLWFDVFNTGCEAFSISKDACIMVGGKDFGVKSAVGIDFGKEIRIPDEGKVSFRLIFPPIGQKAELLDFRESAGGWKLLGVDLTGKLYKDGFPEGLPDEVKRLRIDADAPLPEPFLTMDTTTVRVQILGYPRYSEALEGEMSLIVNNFFQPNSANTPHGYLMRELPNLSFRRMALRNVSLWFTPATARAVPVGHGSSPARRLTSISIWQPLSCGIRRKTTSKSFRASSTGGISRDTMPR